MDSITSFMEKMVETVDETHEEFIFKTINPYCENIAEMKIKKQFLKKALLNYKERDIQFRDGFEICPTCFAVLPKEKTIGKSELYCMDCGQHITRCKKPL